jgi:hypothetical protein
MRSTSSKVVMVVIFIALITFVSTLNAAVISAASCSAGDINTAISRASTGDTVSVPPGNCTWTANITIPDSKKLQILGAGIDVTTVKNTGGTSYKMSLCGSGSRITGFTFHDMWVSFNGTGFRIDHNKFYSTAAGNTGINTSESCGVASAIPAGVIDNNQFYNGRIIVFGGGMMANGEWVLPLGLGTVNNAVYVEDNYYLRTVSPSGNAIDANYGGAYVFRYNTVDGNYLEAHSVQSTNRGTKRWEIYGNILTKMPGITTYYAMRLRAGTGVIFGNRIIGDWNDRYIGFDNVRSYDSVGLAMKCDGTSPWDGNENATGYPCRDQIGMGPDEELWTASNTGPGPKQMHSPAYLWANRNDTGNITADVINSSGNHIKANRDYYENNASFTGTSGVGCGKIADRPATCTPGVSYWATEQTCTELNGMTGMNPVTPLKGILYKCTNTNTWTEAFTPYEYPHPLRGNTMIAPSNLKVIN